MNDHPEYARLPADLLAQLLGEAPAAAQRVKDLLEPALLQRDAMRQAAEELDLLRACVPAIPTTLCAVDGGFAVERTIAVDMVMSVAVGVEGFLPEGTTSPWNDNQYDAFHTVLLHDEGNERLARGTMLTQELGILADAPQDVRIYDGSHLTPVIQLNSAMSSRSHDVNDAFVEHALAKGLLESFIAFVGNPQVVAMPKYDSSRQIADILSTHLNASIPGDDRYIAGLLLRGGEYTRPERVSGPHWRELHFTGAPGTASDTSGLAFEMNAAVQPLRDMSLYFTYWKPFDDSPAYRIEMKPELEASAHSLAVVFDALKFQTAQPFVREPYPQYLADVMAKSVGLGLNAMQAAAHLQLTRSSRDVANQLIHSYRTEGV